MKKLVLTLISGFLLLILNAGCVYSVARYDGPYEGKVIDADSGQPLEGAVVLGVWYKERPTVAGAVVTFYDATETLTDKNGNFKIKGQGLKVLSQVSTMNFNIFKAGYGYERGPWESLKEGYFLKDRVRWVGNKPVIPLRKLTIEMRNSQSGLPVPPPEADLKSIRLMMKEINKDLLERGLQPYQTGEIGK